MYIYITHQVLSRASSCSGSDVPSSPPIRARHAADIYKMYNVTMPTCFDVPSSPEQILSQETPTPNVQRRLNHKTPPRKQVPSIDHKSISPTEKTPFLERHVLSNDHESTSPKQAPSIDDGYVGFIRKVDMELVRAYKDSSTQIVKLAEGPSGCCVALMKEGLITTEVPTVALAPVPGKRNPCAADGANVKRRPVGQLKKSSCKRTKFDRIVCSHVLSFSPTLLTKRASS